MPAITAVTSAGADLETMGLTWLGDLDSNQD